MLAGLAAIQDTAHGGTPVLLEKAKSEALGERMVRAQVYLVPSGFLVELARAEALEWAEELVS